MTRRPQSQGQSRHLLFTPGDLLLKSGRQGRGRTPAPWAAALLALVSSALSPPAFAVAKRPMVLPEITVAVVAEDTADAIAGVEVELLARARKRAAYESVETTVTDRRGRAHFPSRSSDRIAGLAVRASWDEPAKPRRRLLYELRIRPGPKTAQGRGVRLGREAASYLMHEETGGDCLNLFSLEESESRLTLTLRRPSNYAACREGIFPHTDYANVGRRDINAGSLNLFSFDRDVEIGQDFVRRLDEEHPPLEDPQVHRYVDDLVTRLGRASDLPELEFHVQVIDADILNAFALPGGFLFVYRGLIEATETESELVGVLAHEIAHVTSRHGTEGLTSSLTKVVSALALGGLIAHEVSEDEGTRELIMGTLLAGTNFWILGGTRRREAEADRLGAQYALRAGYDPRGLAAFFGKLSASRDRRQTRIDQLFSDHPNDEVRVHNVGEMVDYFLPPGQELITSSPEYLRTKRRLATLAPPKKEGETVASAVFSSFKAANEALLWQELSLYLESQEKETTDE